MATGDILTVTATAAATAGLKNDGWFIDVDIDGFSPGMAVDLGSGYGQPLNDGDTPHIVLTVTSKGFNGGVASTVQRTLYATKVLRQPYPNDSAADQAATAGGARVRLALNEFIYSKDKAGAGNSGTDPVVDIAAGTFRNDAGSSELSAAAVDLTVVNNSAAPYPPAIAQWDLFLQLPASRVAADYLLGVKAEAGHGIDAVRLVATGQTSGHIETVFDAPLVSRQRSASGLSDASYSATIPLAGFTDGETITNRFVVYPLIGDTPVDTLGNTTLADEIAGRNQLDVTVDKSDAVATAYVSTTGNDSTGDGSVGNPYATIGKALAVNALRIYLAAGEYTPGNGNTNVSASQWAVVQPAPGVAQSAAVVRVNSTRPYNHQRLQFRGVTVKLQDTSSWLDGENVNCISFVNCHMESTLASRPSTSVAYRSMATYFINCTGTDFSFQRWAIGGFSSNRLTYWFDGCQLIEADAGAAQLRFMWHFAACHCTGAVCVATPNVAVAGTPAWENIHIRNNRMVANNSTGHKAIEFGIQAGYPSHGIAVVGNEIEKMTTTGPAIAAAADSSVIECNNVLLIRNTVAGARLNRSYNDTGTSGWDRLGWFERFNSWENPNIKADKFGTGNGNRTGGWPTTPLTFFVLYQKTS